MVKLYCISILYKGPTNGTWLKSAYDLQSFNFFQRGSVQEFMSFFCKTIVERSFPSTRQTVKEGEYLWQVYVRSDNLAGVVISDHEYPSRVAHTLITKILDEFSQKVPPVNWPNLQERDVNFLQLNIYLSKYENPKEADAITYKYYPNIAVKAQIRFTFETGPVTRTLGS